MSSKGQISHPDIKFLSTCIINPEAHRSSLHGYHPAMSQRILTLAHWLCKVKIAVSDRCTSTVLGKMYSTHAGPAMSRVYLPEKSLQYLCSISTLSIPYRSPYVHCFNAVCFCIWKEKEPPPVQLPLVSMLSLCEVGTPCMRRNSTMSARPLHVVYHFRSRQPDLLCRYSQKYPPAVYTSCAVLALQSSELSEYRILTSTLRCHNIFGTFTNSPCISGTSFSKPSLQVHIDPQSQAIWMSIYIWIRAISGRPFKYICRTETVQPP